MARIVHGFHLTRKLKHKRTTFLFLSIIVAIILAIGIYSGNSFGSLLSALGLSLFRLIVAYIISLVVATLIAVSISDNKIGDSLIPVFDLMQNLPSFALIPIFVLWLGYTNLMTIVFAATSILWPILFYMLHALKTANKDKEDAAKIFGATGLKKIIFFSLPIAFPAMVTGSIVGFSIGWEAIITQRSRWLPQQFFSNLLSALSRRNLDISPCDPQLVKFAVRRREPRRRRHPPGFFAVGSSLLGRCLFR